MEGNNVTRFRLWLYDLHSGQIAYQDDYCQGCGLTDAVIVQAKVLIEAPHFGPPPDSKPTYCKPFSTAGGESAASAAGGEAGPLYLTVYGDGKHKASLHAALEQQLQLLGKPPLPVTVESHTYTLDVMQRIVAGQQNAHVLGAEAKKDGKVELFYFDQKTNLTHDSSVNCAGCDRDGLIVQVKQAVSDLLDRCFGSQCANSGRQPPAEACEPFPDQQCPGLDDLLSPGPSLPARYIDPTTAKLVKGSLWGLFAGSTATAVGLFAANATSAGIINGNQAQATNGLVRPAWAMTGTSIVVLGLAVPLTLAINHAQRPASSDVSNGAASQSLIQCPN
jgi:hypothetical protein